MHKDLKIFQKNVTDLIPYVNNPRNNAAAVDAVASSIAEFGFNVPIVLDKNNIIVTGHTRLLAAKKLGLESVPCIIADHLTDAQIKAFRLADNRVAELATWDTDLLASELEELADLNFDMSAFGFDEPEADPDDVDECEPEEEAAEEEEATTQRGQIWRLGRHFLMCGDSTDMDDVDWLMAGELADMLLTDPPYNVGYEGGTDEHMTILNDKMDDDKFYNFLLSAFKNAMAVMKDGAPFYIWYAAGESRSFFNAQKDSGLKLSEVLQWVKNVFTLGHYDYHWATESCLYGWKEGAPHYFVSERNHINVIQDDLNIDKMTREQLQETCRMLLDVINTNALRENKPARNDQHPTMKPVKLFAKQIVNSSRKGDKILDLFAGSGTTIMACEQLDRTAYAMELDPIYCDRIIKRWEAQTGKHAELMP
jgi:site-specific DNA-methyltransferase (adenine-specific)